MTMTDSITATQSTRRRTFFWGNSLPRNASLRNFPRILHGTPTKISSFQDLCFRQKKADVYKRQLQATEVTYKYTLVSENGQLVSKVELVDKTGEKGNKITDVYKRQVQIPGCCWRLERGVQ